MVILYTVVILLLAIGIGTTIKAEFLRAELHRKFPPKKLSLEEEDLVERSLRNECANCEVGLSDPDRCTGCLLGYLREKRR